MAKGPLITNERVRAIVVDVAMVVVFALSLAIAMAMSASPAASRKLRTVELDELSVKVPVDWTQAGSSSAVMGFDPQISLQPEGEQGRVLFIGGLEQRVAQNPMVVLDFMINRLARAAALGGLPQGQRHFFSSRHFNVAVWTAQDLPGELFQQHHMAVLSADNQRHWVIYLVSTFEPNEQIQVQMLKDTTLFSSVLQSATLSDRKAEPDTE